MAYNLFDDSPFSIVRYGSGGTGGGSTGVGGTVQQPTSPQATPRPFTSKLAQQAKPGGMTPGGVGIQPQTGAQNAFGGANISSAFGQQPMPFDPSLTNRMVGQASSDIFQQTDPFWLKKMFGHDAASGVANTGGGLATLIDPRIAQGNADVSYARQMIPNQRNLGNAQMGLQWGQGKARDILNQANNLFGSSDLRDQYDLSQKQRWGGLIGDLISGFGGLFGQMGQGMGNSMGGFV